MRLLLALAVLLSSSALAQDAAPTRFYLLIGQSNMAGRAPIPSDATLPLERCLLLDAHAKWIPARNPLNEFSTVRKEIGMQQLGPGYSFARKMAQARPSATIGLVVNARGGTSIAEWQKGKQLYDESVRRARLAMQTAPLAGILWHQGESDARDENYADKLAALVANLRADLDQVPFVCGEVEASRTVVNSAMNRAVKQIPRSACVSAADLKTFDGTHFDTASVLTLGERYADAMLKLLEKP